METIWDHVPLFDKATVYAARAIDTPRDDSRFPLWASFALEFLARAALAFVHPALLADPRNEKSTHYVFGFGNEGEAKSLQMTSVVKRCVLVIPEFTAEDEATCVSLVDRRNVELHSGAPAFADFPTELWLAKYFRACSILLDFQDKSVADLFGDDQEDAIVDMIDALDAKVKGHVMREVAKRRKAFRRLSKKRQSDARAEDRRRIKSFPGPVNIVECPACDSRAFVWGKRFGPVMSRLESDEIYQDQAVLPTDFLCGVCGLSLSTHSELHAADIGGQFTDHESFDAIQHYAEQQDDRDSYEDYGNE